MVRRWLIRSLFLLPLVCVVALWVTSYFGGLALNKHFGEGYRETGAVQGLGFLDYVHNVSFKDTLIRATFARGRTTKEWIRVPMIHSFYYGRLPPWADSYEIIFPLWLPTLLLLVFNLLVWRKTRPKPQGRVFPIEPTNNSAKTK